VKLADGSFSALIKAILRQGYSLRCRTLGTSMLPLIRSGTIIQVEPVKVQDLQVGDVVVYHDSADALVAHRLIGKSLFQGKIVLTMKGDAFSRSAAERVAAEQVLGRVTAVEWGRGLRIRFNSAPGKLLGILLAGISPPDAWLSGIIQVKQDLTSLLQKIKS
jgi:signal peptidase I